MILIILKTFFYYYCQFFKLEKLAIKLYPEKNFVTAIAIKL